MQVYTCLMVISMRPHASRAEIDHVCDRIREFGYRVHSIEGEGRVAVSYTHLDVYKRQMGNRDRTAEISRSVGINS